MSGLYNMLHGVNMAAFVIYPVLEFGKPEEFPRFRDCHLTDDEKQIKVYCRMGGGNNCCWDSDDEEFKDDCDCVGCKAEKYRKHELCQGFVEDDYDCTYATFTFDIPDKWKSDIEKVLKDKQSETSKGYKELILSYLTKEESKEIIKKWLGA